MGIGIALAAVLAACGGGGGGGGGTNDITVGITTQGAASTVAAGGQLGMQANVNNASDTRITWSMTGSGCGSNCGTLTPSANGATYAAPANVPAQFTVTIVATSVQDPSKSGQVVLTVTASPVACAPHSGDLNGQYAFLLQGFDDVSPYNAIAAVGSVTADACGNFVGTLDFAPNATPAAVNVSGTYTVGADHRGTATLTFGSTTKHFAIALGRYTGGSNPYSQQGALTESDTATYNHVTGAMWRRDPTAFTQAAIAANYAYLLNGWLGSPIGGWSPAWHPAGPRWGIGGTVTLASNGSLTSGLQDQTEYSSTPTTGHSWSGTTTAFSTSTGRGTLSAGSFDGAGNAVVYVVNSGQLLVLISDAGNDVLSGQMLAQTGAPFSQASLQGTFITNQSAHHMGSGYQYMNYSSVGLWAADGVSPTGTITTSINDASSGCNISSGASASYSYQVAANGQVAITSGATLAGKYYLVSANTGLMLGADPGVSIGALRPQSGGPFSLASISGSYYGTQAPGAAVYSTNSSGVATSSGNGTLASTMDQNNGTFSTAGSVGGTLTHTGSGRYLDQNNNAIYVVSPTSFLVVGISPNDCYPVVHVFAQ